VARNRQKLEATVGAITQSGGQAAIWECDVNSAEQINAVAALRPWEGTGPSPTTNAVGLV
jgi:hypothetical protein